MSQFDRVCATGHLALFSSWYGMMRRSFGSSFTRTRFKGQFSHNVQQLVWSCWIVWLKTHPDRFRTAHPSICGCILLCVQDNFEAVGAYVRHSLLQYEEIICASNCSSLFFSAYHSGLNDVTSKVITPARSGKCHDTTGESTGFKLLLEPYSAADWQVRSVAKWAMEGYLERQSGRIQQRLLYPSFLGHQVNAESPDTMRFTEYLFALLIYCWWEAQA